MMRHRFGADNRFCADTALGRGVLAVMAAAGLAGCAVGGEADAAGVPADITIEGSGVYPESMTADDAGNIYNGSVPGTIYRALAGEAVSTPWIIPSRENGIGAIYGVFADDAHGMLWACNNPAFGQPAGEASLSSLKGFDLASGALKVSHDFPAGQRAACNDIAVAPDGAIWASETSGGRIFTLAPDGAGLVLFAAGEELAGIDGIAFDDDGTIYINNVRQQLFQRVKRDADGAYAGLTTLQLDHTLDGPDGLRALGGGKFLQAEGGPAGRIAVLRVEGDSATVTPVEGLPPSPAVTRVGKIGYTSEGKIQYLINPEFKDKDPGAFVIRAFNLPEGL